MTSVESATFADARARRRPQVTSLRDWITWPARKYLFDRTAAAWRARPHKYACPACGVTSADSAQCCGRWGGDMGAHKWYGTSAGGYPATRVWIAEPMVPIEDPRAVAAIAAYKDRSASRKERPDA